MEHCRHYYMLEQIPQNQCHGLSTIGKLPDSLV